MSEPKVDFDGVEPANTTYTIGWTDAEDFDTAFYSSELVIEALKEVEDKVGGSTNIEVDLVTNDSDMAPVLAFKPRYRSEAILVAPRIEHDSGEELEFDGDEDAGPQPSDIPAGKKSDVNKRLVQAEQMRRGNNLPSNMDTYLAGYIDAHYKFKDELGTMEATLEVYGDD